MKNLQWISQIKALGWDLDGTLYRSFPSSSELSKIIAQRQIQAVAKRKGWNLGQAKKAYKKRYRELGSNTKTMISFGIDGIKFFTSFWDEIDLGKFIKRDERTIDLFYSLRGKRHFLISNSNRIDQIERKLKLIGLSPSVFDFVVSTVELGVVKPDPQPFLVALEKLKLEPKQVLFIGDRERTDVLGAKGVGMKTCLVWGKSDEADVSLESVYEVGALFGIDE